MIAVDQLAGLAGRTVAADGLLGDVAIRYDDARMDVHFETVAAAGLGPDAAEAETESGAEIAGKVAVAAGNVDSVGRCLATTVPGSAVRLVGIGSSSVAAVAVAVAAQYPGPGPAVKLARAKGLARPAA